MPEKEGDAIGFGKDFLWGAATAAAQIEGGWTDGGRTPSIWDMAPSQHIRNGETCHDGCDHYHRVEEDVALMKEIGLRSYRFSVSWSRILPREGVVNPEGVRFYVNLVKQLRENGIEPIVTSSRPTAASTTKSGSASSGNTWLSSSEPSTRESPSWGTSTGR